jgi:mono/diheme cytochrome c family protein
MSSITSLKIWGTAALTALSFVASRAPSQTPSGGAELQATVDRYCAGCHNARLKIADLVLDPSAATHPGDDAEKWEKVLRRLRAGTMPPPGSPRPEGAIYSRTSAYLAHELETVAAARPNPGKLPNVHRLSRTEYQNAIRDLLDLTALPKELDYATLLPTDNVSSGFDNLADTLFMSPGTTERYVAAARKIAKVAVGDRSMDALVSIHPTPLRQPQDNRIEKLPFGTRGGTAIESYFPLTGEYEFRVQTTGAGREAHLLEISIDGESKQTQRIASNVRSEEVQADVGDVWKFRFPVAAGPRAVGVTFLERSEALPEGPLRPPARSRGLLPNLVGVTITGPFNPTGPGDTPTRRRIFVCSPTSVTEESACADRILTTMVRRAYRRNVTAADLGPVRRFYETGRAERDFELGIQRALERILVSPQFLFRIEEQPANAAPGTVYPINGFELASRLSFFLWSSIPDDALLDAAANGTLRRPEVLAQHVNRMLADPRSESLINNFAAQWLFLRDVETKDPDLYLFREFDEGLRASFVRETELFLDSILRQNRSVLDLITANYTFLNERLAKHYGIPNVTGSHFRQVSLPADSPRAGLLGQGSIQLLTSYPIRTSPVLRGKYVLENLLASPPPPPPANIPALKTENSGQALSMKEAMQLHRANPTCASCHAKMDPIGFALETFDATGRYRTEENGRPIDNASNLPDGTLVKGIDGVRQLILKSPDMFVEAMTNKLLMYGLGRNVQYYDEPAIRAIARDAARANNTFAAQVLGVASSLPFQNRLVPTRTPEKRE